MKNGRVVASRYAMSLVVSVMCLMMASCSGSKAIGVPDNDQSRFEETTKELRKKAQGGDASAQNELGLLYYEGKSIVTLPVQPKQFRSNPSADILPEPHILAFA